MSGRRRSWASQAVAVALGISLLGISLLWPGLVASGAPAQAGEVVPRPSSGQLRLAGHGFGHGHGMSQWGAYGAARRGLTYQQILAFYYPGTTLGSLVNTPIVVRITSDTDGATEVLAQPGLVATSGTRSVALPASTSIPRWRVTSASGYRLQYLSASSGGVWRDYDLTGNGSPPSGPISFGRAAGTVRLLLPGGIFREYVGAVGGVRYNGVHSSVVGTGLEAYLRGVVPNEMPASWDAAALQAQTVAARTYAANQRAASPAGRPFQTCDSTACQVFAGSVDYSTTGAVLARHTEPRTDAAIAATVTSAGVPVVVRYGTALAFTEFGSSNGGYSTAGNAPYLVARPDPYDGVVANDAHSWNDIVPVSTLEAANPSIGQLRWIRVVRDGHGDWGGRVQTVTLVGSTGQVTIAGGVFARQAGLLHSWWAARYSPRQRDLTGDGVGDLLARVAASGDLRVYPGRGAGFASGMRLGVGWSGMSAVQACGDLTGDGRLDVVAVQRSTGRLLLYPGTSSGRLGAARVIGTGWSSLRQVSCVGDFSGDAQPDVVGIGADGRLWLYAGTGAGGLRSRQVAGTGWSGFDRLVGVGDLNGDAYPDLLGRIASSGRLAIYWGDGHGSFMGTRWLSGGGWNAMSQLAAGADLDADGYPDVLAVERATGVLWRYAGASGGLGARVPLGTGWTGIDLLG